ncbi:PQQ-dependent sugar dehydrogenase [Meridianimaribacter flavus]|uniref:PQQ-dependent dehydrogenase (S-GDH family) n=1 Tax=Meridianimaribacter flavus TaxID=571115 RepID=A0ABY2G7I2_9FLAO|nr:PQQ-dependent sugar dehydrogenase [Meridianimaribacter flavus]TDY13761.1 PQQ-dependent dehydrogenase (s-GDH family) [Meridianimaribacter flavus]
MKLKLLNLTLFALFTCLVVAQPVTNNSDWTVQNVTADHALDYPWEVTYAPDGNLWITERVGEKIVRFNTTTESITTMIDLSAKVANSTQGGLLGMAIHPALYNDITTTTNNYVFAAYNYDDNGYKLRIVRLVYNHATGNLTEDTSLNPNGSILEGLPGSGDHNSGRLIIGPDLKLYYTVGDQGANQFSYSCNPILSQVLPTSSTDYDNYPGKTLRINIDGSIPTDNPVLNGVKSHVNTYGHRNAQGIVFSQDGTLYASEHGPKTDDEINIITSGGDYGWPEIAGYYDNLAYTYCNWSSLEGACNAGSFSDHNCPSGADTATEYESYPSGAPNNFQPPIGTYNSTITTDPSGGWFTWPTVAPSSIDIHEVGNIPGWGRSLLIPSLKKGTIYRAKLTPEGTDIVGDSYEEFHSSNDRYRDIAISPDGLTIYAVTDNGGGTSGPSSNSGVSIENPGLIVKIQYVGSQVVNGPTANCQDIIVTLDATGSTTITANDIDNGSTGGSAGIDSIAIDRDAFSCEDTYEAQTVWLTVTDNDGNESRCTALVTVQPNSNPDPITAPSLDDIVSNCAITVEAPVITSNGCQEITATTTDNVTFNSGESGTITWSFNDNGNIVTSSQNVTVNTLSVPQNISVSPGATNAYVSWDEIEGVTFDVRYRELSEFTWIETSSPTNSIELTGLDVLTDYELQVRSNCGASYSSYSTTTYFTTLDIEYCDAVGTTDGGGNKTYITRVALSNVNNPSGETTYSDFTSQEAVLSNAVGNYNLTIDCFVGQSWINRGISVWIDYNIDGDFEDSNERVVYTSELISGSVPSTTYNISLPSSFQVGRTRMRVIMTQWYTQDSPCGTFTNISEVEDYAISLEDNTLSIQDEDAVNFSVYPNPMKDNVTVKLPSNVSFNNLNVKLYDVQGRVIKQRKIENSQREIVFDNLSSLNSGFYFIRIMSDNKQLLSKKLIKL